MFNTKIQLIWAGFLGLNIWVITVSLNTDSKKLNTKNSSGRGEQSRQLFDKIHFFKSSAKSQQLHLEYRIVFAVAIHREITIMLLEKLKKFSVAITLNNLE